MVKKQNCVIGSRARFASVDNPSITVNQWAIYSREDKEYTFPVLQNQAYELYILKHTNSGKLKIMVISK